MKLLRSREPVSETGTVPAPDIDAPAPAHGPRASKARIGDMLVALGTISEDQLQAALSEQRSSGRRLGEVLIAMGALHERDFLKTLAEQLGIPLVDLRSVTPEADALSHIPESMVRSENVLPVSIDDGELAIAISTEPTDDLV